MAIFTRKSPAVPVRGIHLDLKGLPPTPRRLLELLDIMAAARVNCVLVEWEDVYPWRRYPELRCPTAYSRAAVARFLGRARDLGIEVIPLVQCFGHLETVLAKRRFARLRERPDNVAELCPSKPESGALVLELVRDILETHRGFIRRFHLGGDEAWTMGSCPACKQAVARGGKAPLYRAHVEPLLDALAAEGIRPILWDDMMRRWSAADLKRLAPKTDLMAWTYGADPFSWLKPEVLDRYAAAGVRVWGAGAFKGADGPVADVPDPAARVANMSAWTAEAVRRKMAGVVATGWSRYCTIIAPCEGMEASLDMLVAAGAIMWDGRPPADPPAEALGFMKKGRLAGIAAEPFVRCAGASRALTAWRRRAAGVALEWSRFGFLAKEPERCNPLEVRRYRTEILRMLREGRPLAAAWKAAHRGLVPEIWLGKYAASRTMPLERIVRMIAREIVRR